MTLDLDQMPEPPAPTMREICREVADKHGISITDLCSDRHVPHLVIARDEAAYRCRFETRHSYPRIGRALGNRHHSTVIVAVRRHAARMNGETFSREARRAL